MSKLLEKKVFRDPIYGYITIEDDLIWNLLNTKEMQRLKRIKQLGGVSSVFHTAEHSRFSHCLGVYHLAYKVYNEVVRLKEYISHYEKLLFFSCALLHDIGHGPFSHAFEESFKTNHEEIGSKIIQGNSQINEVLCSVDKDFSNEVAKVLLKKSDNMLIQELISSQLDIDRLDYLQRDAYFTGAKYGEVDVDRIIRTMKISNGHIVHKASSVVAIEDYLMSRYNMYWQVYFHPTGRSFELIISSIYKRISYLYKNQFKFSSVYKPIINLIKSKQILINDYIRLDDYVVFNIIMECQSSDDDILRDLSSRILSRNLFKDKVIKDLKEVEVIKKKLIEDGFSLEYYFYLDNLKQVIYSYDYDLDKAKNIKLIDDNYIVHDLVNYSKIIKALIDIDLKQELRVFYPTKE